MEDAISQLQKAQDSLHNGTSKRIDELQNKFDRLSDQEATLERTTTTHDDKLQNEAVDVDRLRHWVEEISHRISSHDKK
jgi:hypothetical protein